MELLKQSYVKYALLMCAILTACLLVAEITGQDLSIDKSPIQAIFMMVAPFVVWYLGIRAKKKILKGKMSFKQGLTEGWKLSLAYGVISPFIFLLYYLFINYEILEYARTAYGLTGASDAVVIAVDMIVQFLVATIFGTIYAAIIAFFLKTNS